MSAWERRPNESGKGYEKFLYFLSLGTAERSIKAVAEHFGVRRQTVQMLASKNEWQKRARQFDAYQMRREELSGRMSEETSKELTRENVNAALAAKLAIVDEILVAELEKVKQQQDAGNEVEPLHLRRLLSAITDVDRARRVILNLPTSIKGKSVDVADEDDDPAVFYVGNTERTKRGDYET